ncbi:MAG: hypothetical protein EKK68_08695 [Candidatus Competibacteraceae bacterium]|nr:MAG: hypothetical protein EKK68_08695 [Candidatus Competibacteraceae bacterium]
MNLKTWIRLGGILTVLLVTTPILAVAQGYGRDRATERGPIQIDNNWRDSVHITVWTDRGEELGGGWQFSSGESAFLAVGERKIKVRPNYQIKVGDDWGRVNVGNVGRFQNGVWYVNVRDLWRTTHRNRGNDRNRSPDQRNAPDYLR